jgi:alpha-glucoside transport system substrate-binding protein
MIQRKRGLLALLLALAMLVAACGGDSGTDTTAGDGATDDTAETGDTAGEDTEATDAETDDTGDAEAPAGGEENMGSVSVAGAPTGVEGDAINSVIEEQINSADGVEYTATYEGSDSFEQDVVIRIEGGNPPDIALWPQPGAVVSQAREGNLVALEDLGVDMAQMESLFGDYLLGLAAVDGKHYGIPTNVNFKSMVWYNVPAFEAAGYEVPETFDDLMALSDQIVADGGTPWCIGIGSDAATGWPATDWMEDIVLRQAGPEVYDQWVSGELPFDSPEITAALDTFGQVLHTEGYVLGGASQIPSIDFRDAPDPVFSSAESPNCWLHRQASFITTFFDPAADAFPDGLTPVEDYDFFVFPPIDGNGGALIAGEMGAVLNNRPEVLDFLQRFMAQEAQCAQGQLEGISRISPNIEVGADCYVNPLTASSAEAITTALADGTARFDASDLMPPEVGSGSFWQGMIDYATGGPDNAQSVLQSIDAAWPAG